MAPAAFACSMQRRLFTSRRRESWPDREGHEANNIGDSGENHRPGQGRVDTHFFHDHGQQCTGTGGHDQVDHHGHTDHQADAGILEPQPGGDTNDSGPQQAIDGPYREFLEE